LLARLDTLGDNMNAYRLSEGDDQFHNRLRLRASARGFDECPVNLQDIHRQLAELIQRRISGTEVVDSEPHSTRTEPLQYGDCLAHAAHQALGHPTCAAASGFDVAARRSDAGVVTTIPVIPITDLLLELGFRSEEAQRTGRAALEAAKLTNPRKKNLAVPKREAAAAAIVAGVARCCGSDDCRAALIGEARPVAIVDRAACEICEGGRTAPAVRELGRALVRAGKRELLLLGGVPGAHDELRRGLDGSGVELRVVDGTTTRPLAQARAWADAADLIVVWATTPLDHRVSLQFTRPEYRGKTITVSRRGAGALARDITRAVRGGSR